AVPARLGASAGVAAAWSAPCGNVVRAWLGCDSSACAPSAIRVPSSAAICGSVTPPELCAEPLDVPPVAVELPEPLAGGGACAPCELVGVDGGGAAALELSDVAAGVCTGAGRLIGTAALSVFGSFFGADDGWSELLRAATLELGSNAKAA